MACPVCLEALAAEECKGVADDALACPNGHNVCCAASSSRYCSPTCSGLSYACPVSSQAEGSVDIIKIMMISRFP
eukprot:2665971-Prymnesium_polylepis.1